jgi:hypothetical protein
MCRVRGMARGKNARNGDGERRNGLTHQVSPE